MTIETKSEFYDYLVDELCTQMQTFVDEGPEGSPQQFIDLILLLIDSLIFNLYSRHRSSDKTKIHNSLYQASVISIGQGGSGYNPQKIGESGAFTGSMAIQPSGPSEVKVFMAAIERLLSDERFFQNLHILLSYNDNDSNKLQLSYFVNSLEYIVEKEGISEDGLNKYTQNRQEIEEFIVEKQKMAVQEEIDYINQIIFSKQLLKIKTLLNVRNDTAQPREVQFTILRLYFAAYSKKRTNFKRKLFQELQYSGDSMVHSLMKLYIKSQSKRDLLFRDNVQDPIGDFILNYLLLLYIPIYYSFEDIFNKHIYPYGNEPPQAFFKSIEQTIRQIVIPFFDQLPCELCNFLAELYILVQQSPQFKDAIPPQFPVTMLFINRFLLNPDFKSQDEGFDQDKFIKSANMFKDLFYPNMVKNYSSVPIFTQLSEGLCSTFIHQITTYDVDKTVDVYSYHITDPLLRNDYNYLYGYISMIKFSQLDKQEFEIDTFNPSTLPKRSKVITNPASLIIQEQQQKIQSPKKVQEQQVNIQKIGEKQIIGDSSNSKDRDIQNVDFPIPANRQQPPSDREIIERLTGLRSVEEQQEVTEDSFRIAKKPEQQYEDYNQRQKQQYLQQFQSPHFQQKKETHTQTDKNDLLEEKHSNQSYVGNVDLSQTPNNLSQFTSFDKKQQDRVSSQHSVDRHNDSDLQIEKNKQKELEKEIVRLKQNLEEFKQVSKLNVQEAVQKAELPLKQIIQSLELDQADLVQKSQKELFQTKSQYEKQLKLKDAQIFQQLKEINNLEDELQTANHTIQQNTSQIQQQDEEIHQLHQKIGEIQDEKILLQKHFNGLSEDYMQYQPKSAEEDTRQNRSSQNDEFYQISDQIKQRQAEVHKLQAEHEMHSKKIRRKQQ